MSNPGKWLFGVRLFIADDFVEQSGIFMGKAFYFDSTACTGCKTCELACKDYHDLGPGITYRRVIDIEGGAWQWSSSVPVQKGVYVYHVSLACAHCDNGICLSVCPTGAMHRDKLGFVWPDHKKCVGCGYCAMACPYGAPSLDYQAKKSSKCDGCTDRVGAGKLPVCVEACPLRALWYGSESELVAAHLEAVRYVPPLPDPSVTSPNYYVKPCPASLLADEEGGWIANEGEL